MQTSNETHDPCLSSWVDSANAAACDFPVQNLPFGVFRARGSGEAFRGGVAIGDRILDLGAAAGTFDGLAATAAASAGGPTLNALMAMGAPAWSALRLALSRALRASSTARRDIEPHLMPMADAELALPAEVGDYTDFYTSIHHATNIGRLFRPDNPLLPNYRWVPIGYHGRSSSIGVSGQQFLRPLGQTRAADAETPALGPCKRLDYELELGIWIGAGNRAGEAISVDAADAHAFGLCLLNDWSARDIQAWEYQPLGPFLAKNFATTISPWIVTLEALAPFRQAFERGAGEPAPLPYLDSPDNRAAGAFDIHMEVAMLTASMHQAGADAARLSRSNFRYSYWTLAQMVTHHTIGGCPLRPGDLFGTGTQSGPGPGETGSLIELTGGGKTPVTLPNGESRTFVEDGDTIVMRAWCEGHGARRIGFGEAVGQVLPAAT